MMVNFILISGPHDDFAKVAVMLTEDMYKRPGKIINKEIVTFSENGMFKLKDNLQELYDYIKVNEQAWEQLKDWYGCDYEVWV
jgi:hypothetical protein